MRKPELLSPAGSMKNLRYALHYGADAVYAGQPRYSLRVRNNEFTLAKLQEARDYTSAHHKQLYIVNNIAPHNTKLKTFVQDLAPVAELQPDAMIMSDPGIIMLTREHFPDLPIHLSVQANAVNWAAVKFWQQQGIKRVILSRELGLNEIEEIRQRCPDIERLETGYFTKIRLNGNIIILIECSAAIVKGPVRTIKTIPEAS